MQIVAIEISELEQLIETAVERAVSKSANAFVTHIEPKQKLLNVQDVAALLNVSISSVNAYKKQGKIPFHRLGRRVFFKEDEVLLSLKRIDSNT